MNKIGMIQPCIVQSLRISTPDHTRHTAINHVMCSGGTVESHMPYSIGIHATVGAVAMF